jgi:hypothetical protein
MRAHHRPPRIPDHLSHLISRQGSYLAIPSHVAREVIRLIDPNATPHSVSLRMNVDEANARRLFNPTFRTVSEMKIDRLLVAFDSTHLWLEPPLNEYRLAILEYEEAILAREDFEAVA